MGCLIVLNKLQLLDDLVDLDHFSPKRKSGGDSEGYGGTFQRIMDWIMFEDKQVIEKTKKTIRECKIPELLKGSVRFDIVSIKYWLNALILGSKHWKDDFNIITARFCLNLMTKLILYNKDRVSLFWDIVFQHFQDLLQSNEPRLVNR